MSAVELCRSVDIYLIYIDGHRIIQNEKYHKH